jgi:hypothetical protein
MAFGRSKRFPMAPFGKTWRKGAIEIVMPRRLKETFTQLIREAAGCGCHVPTDGAMHPRPDAKMSIPQLIG